MRFSRCHLILFILVFTNIFLLWFLMHHQPAEEIHQNSPKKGTLDVTVIIPEFENFDNNVEDTVQHFETLYPRIPFLVISQSIPYPYFGLPARNAQFVITKTNLDQARHLSDPLFYIKTKYILVVPDSTRLKDKGALDELVWLLRKNEARSQIIVAPITSPHCVSIEIELKRWTLIYKDTSTMNHHCDYIIGDSVLLFDKRILMNFTEVFEQPFFESFFIQAKLRDLNVHVTDHDYFQLGKILYADNHFKWKHNEHNKVLKEAFYKRFGIKRVVNRGVETMYGCTKSTKRCFPSILDVPFYLYEGRWTPPCCLNNLRETARHVFRTLDNWNVRYWLEGGCLLGAARYNDIIPWDYDADVGIYRTDIERSEFLSEVWNGKSKTDREGFVWEKDKEQDQIRVQFSKTNHLHVDIFPFYEKNGMMTKDTWFKSHKQDMEFPVHFLQPLEYIQFVGIEVSVPNNYKLFLEMKFGKGVIENPQYPFPEKLMNIGHFKNAPPKNAAP